MCFSPFSILSGYASLNMAPMMRAPELTAPGNLSNLIFRNLLNISTSGRDSIQLKGDPKAGASTCRRIGLRNSR